MSISTKGVNQGSIFELDKFINDSYRFKLVNFEPFLGECVRALSN